MNSPCNTLLPIIAKWVLIGIVYILTLWPSSALIKNLMAHVTGSTAVQNDGLDEAGKWIGFLERIITLSLVLKGQYEAVGLLATAKSIIRFRDTATAQKTSEQVLIGTLSSLSIAIIAGEFLKHLLAFLKL